MGSTSRIFGVRLRQQMQHGDVRTRDPSNTTFLEMGLVASCWGSLFVWPQVITDHYFIQSFLGSHLNSIICLMYYGRHCYLQCHIRGINAYWWNVYVRIVRRLWVKWNQRSPRGKRWKRRGGGGGHGHPFWLAGARHNPCGFSATIYIPVFVGKTDVI